MLNQNRPNTPITKSQLKKLACVLGITGLGTLISFPVLAKYYAAVALFQPSAHRNYSYRSSNKTIADTLQQNPNFANLYDELKQANLLDDLKQGNYTIFAPTNEAFKALPKNVFERYSQSQNRPRVLKYHLVANQVKANDTKELNGKLITTVEGNQIKITVDPQETVKLNDATGKHPSIKATNGVIIEVDKVLLPPGF